MGDQIKPVTKERMTQMADNFGTDGWDVCYANAQELNDVKENNGVFRQELRSLTSRWSFPTFTNYSKNYIEMKSHSLSTCSNWWG